MKKITDLDEKCEIGINANLIPFLIEVFTRDILEDKVQRWIYDLIGPEATLKLALTLSGYNIRFPSYTLLNKLKRKYALLKYDGHNNQKLAVRLGVDERTIRAWVKKEKREQKNSNTQIHYCKKISGLNDE